MEVGRPVSAGVCLSVCRRGSQTARADKEEGQQVSSVCRLSARTKTTTTTALMSARASCRDFGTLPCCLYLFDCGSAMRYLTQAGLSKTSTVDRAWLWETKTQTEDEQLEVWTNWSMNVVTLEGVALHFVILLLIYSILHMKNIT